jgi:hypothetical protein
VFLLQVAERLAFLMEVLQSSSDDDDDDDADDDD